MLNNYIELTDPNYIYLNDIKPIDGRCELLADYYLNGTYCLEVKVISDLWIKINFPYFNLDNNITDYMTIESSEVNLDCYIRNMISIENNSIIIKAKNTIYNSRCFTFRFFISVQENGSFYHYASPFIFANRNNKPNEDYFGKTIFDYVVKNNSNNCYEICRDFTLRYEKNEKIIQFFKLNEFKSNFSKELGSYISCIVIINKLKKYLNLFKNNQILYLLSKDLLLPCNYQKKLVQHFLYFRLSESTPEDLVIENGSSLYKIKNGSQLKISDMIKYIENSSGENTLYIIKLDKCNLQIVDEPFMNSLMEIELKVPINISNNKKYNNYTVVEKSDITKVNTINKIAINDTKDQVQKWLQKYNDGYFADIAKFLIGVDGTIIYNLSQDQLLLLMSSNGMDTSFIGKAFLLFNLIHQSQ